MNTHEENFLDDVPRIDVQPARSWRHEPRIEPLDAAKCGVAGLVCFVVAVAFIVLAFCL